MAMREGETLKTYSDRYWETYNEINGNFEDVAMKTFKVGLPAWHELRKSLKIKSASNMRQLMDRIDKYKTVEDDQIQGKGKAKMFPEKRDPRGGRYPGNHIRRDFPNQTLSTGAQLVNSLFKKPVYQMLEKIKSEFYFKWPNRMSGDSSKRNQNLYCHYHQDRGHTTEDYRTLRDHLNQLVKAGKLNQFLHQPMGQFGHSGVEFHRGNIPQLALGIINVIFAKPGSDVEACYKVMSVGGFPDLDARDQAPKRAKVMVTPILGFSEEDKEGTF